ncbi:uncharacterized protein VDAG_00339 [Verticillium dahliae VdLs.17]|uniref:Uncharacterized protein n=1 Tax=Verticillium dahliae (strain VdLs.17 / ATCC MYA-4575 / FGSC 10137) TaxID=498257 RepID=G2WS06_VERDV|nr:uncharacterized protein VDAG_00339 [Verticillium dahliae VdLs.17]EGY13657.1 hypothetical protein VDAG_00339 [Verticillium dahliae VdLs.17]
MRGPCPGHSSRPFFKAIGQVRDKSGRVQQQGQQRLVNVGMAKCYLSFRTLVASHSAAPRVWEMKNVAGSSEPGQTPLRGLLHLLAALVVVQVRGPRLLGRLYMYLYRRQWVKGMLAETMVGVFAVMRTPRSL